MSSARAKAPRRSRKTKPAEKTARKAGPAEASAAVVPPALLGPAIPTMISLGYGNLIAASRVVAIMSPGSSPMRRLREQASDVGKLVDATEGRRTRSIVVTDSDHIILSALNPDTIASRFEPGDSGGGE